MGFEGQQKQEKTKEQLLEEFKNSLEEYNIEAECYFSEQGELTIEQNVKSGIRNLGYDDGLKHKENDERNNSLWINLNQLDPKDQSEKQRKNPRTGTMLDKNKNIKGVDFNKINDETIEIRIAKNHPIATLSELIKRPFHLPGRFSNWKFDEPLEKDEQTGELVKKIKWDGETIVNDDTVKCKGVFADTPCDWDSGRKKKVDEQKLIIKNAENIKDEE